jgi:hypothetical protein
VKSEVTREKVDTFDAAVFAFEYRLETKLTNRWTALEYEATLYYGAPPGEYRRALDHFFEEAERAIQNVVHEYFPKLLQVAAFHSRRIPHQSPQAWTKEQLLRQVCAFLGVDEKFDHSSAPREDSKLVEATARIARGIEEPEEAIPADFVLPGWASLEWIMREALGSKSSTERNNRSLPPLSRVETLEWFKHREWSISRTLEQQIEEEGWEAIIDAGKSDISILNIFSTSDPSLGTEWAATASESPGNIFAKETSNTWLISFGGETCHLGMINGLDYIAILLQNPGKSISARELLVLAIHSGAELSHLDAGMLEDGIGQESDDQETRFRGDGDFGSQEQADIRALRAVEQKLLSIKNQLAINEGSNFAALRDEQIKLENYLKGSQNIHGRPRRFPNINEKARQSITKAIKRACKNIEERSPKTATYLQDHIETGSIFTYRDNAILWKVQRTPRNRG